MPSDPEREAPAGLGSGGTLNTSRLDRQAHGTAAALEALVFVGAARQWIDHGLAGDVGIVEAAVAAQLLLARAESLALAA